MPDQPTQPGAPQRVIPIDPPAPADPSPPDPDRTVEIPLATPVPVIPMTEPGVVSGAPFAKVYSPSAPNPTATSPTTSIPAIPNPSASNPSTPATPPQASATAPPPPPIPTAQPALAPPFASPYGHPAQGYHAPPQAYAAPPPSYYPPNYQRWPDAPQYVYGAQSRPGLVTALGITSIIVASLSIICSLFSGCTSLGIMSNARRAAATGRMTTMPTVSVSASSIYSSTQPAAIMPESPMQADGLGEADRAALLDAIQNKRHSQFPPGRWRQVNGLLAQHGRLIFDNSSRLSIQSAMKDIAKSGQEYADTGKTGPDFFFFQSGDVCKLPGQLKVWDDHAVYYVDGGETIRVAIKEDSVNPSAGTNAPGPFNVTPTPAPNPALTSNSVASVSTFPGFDSTESSTLIATISQRSNNKLNASQTQALSNEFQSPGGARWVTPSSNLAGLTSQVKSAIARGDGSMTIAFQSAQLTVDSSGAIDFSQSSPMAGFSGGAGAGGFVTPMLGVDSSACTAASIEAVLSGLLAIFLLVTGILLLKQKPITHRFYLIYAIAKMLVGIVGIWAFSTILKSMSAPENDPMMLGRSLLAAFSGMATAMLVIGIIGLIYPLVVLIVLMSKSMKDYYKSA